MAGVEANALTSAAAVVLCGGVWCGAVALVQTGSKVGKVQSFCEICILVMQMKVCGMHSACLVSYVLTECVAVCGAVWCGVVVVVVRSAVNRICALV